MKITALRILLFIVILFAIFFSYQPLMKNEYVETTPEEGRVDLRIVDMENDIAFVRARNWEYYGEKYYLAEDFASATPPEKNIAQDSGASARYGTHRILLDLPAGKTYGISGMSLLYSQRMYINGELIAAIGWPGTDKESTTPKTQQYFYAFTPRTDTTEIIYHVADFHIGDAAGKYPFYIGEFQRMSHDLQSQKFSAFLVIGCLVTCFVYYLGMFLFFPSYKRFLYLACLCVFICLRTLITGDKLLITLFPAISWEMAYRLEYWDIGFLLLFFTLYCKELFPGTLHRYFLRGVIAAVCAFSLFVACTQPLQFTAIITFVNIFWAICVLWISFCVIRWILRKKPKELDILLVIVGLGILVVGALDDLYSYIFSYGRPSQNMLQRTMLVCIFIHMIALVFEFVSAQKKLSEEQLRTHELHETNLMLARLGDMKTQFMANISHELKTPLTIISTNAQLSKVLLLTENDAGEIMQNLDTISMEARRLARMVNEILDFTSLQENQVGLQSLDISPLLLSTAEVYRSMFQEKGNRLLLTVPPSLPPVYANADILVQVIVNLLANANQHTENGDIRIEAGVYGENIEVMVADNGHGIAPEELPHIFERRHSASGGAGLGLAICKNIIDQLGGKIYASSAQYMGTTIQFTLPIWKEDTHGENDIAR